jgi:hypothetical protein
MISINLREQREDLQSDVKYKLKISNRLLKNKSLKIKFPNTNAKLFDGESCINLNKYTSFVKLDQAIAKRLQNTKIADKYVNLQDPVHSLKMTIEFQSKLYNIWGVINEHNYYVYWLESFTSFVQDTGYVSEIEENIPVLIEMDGKGEFLNIVPFCEKELVEPLFWSRINALVIPIVELFTCEIIPKQRPEIKSLSCVEATKMVRKVDIKEEDFMINFEIQGEISLNSEDEIINHDSEPFDLVIGK